MNNQNEIENLVKDFLSKPKNIVKSTQGFSETPIEAAERIFRAGLKAGYAASPPSEVKSKEDILDGYESHRVMTDADFYEDLWPRGCIEQAMEEYANQFRLSEQGSDGWIDVKDELPKKSTARDLYKVQIYCRPLGVSDGHYWGTNDDPCKGWSIEGVTHWRPLPSAPQSKE